MKGKSSYMDIDEIYIELSDNQWDYEYTDNDRQIARAVVFDGDGLFWFVRASRDDEFGSVTTIETSGGGVENGEELTSAVKRELKEELGTECDVICKIGIVSDYYNLIHRHNINNYFLCKVISEGENSLTRDEKDLYHLTTVKLSYENAVKEYKEKSSSKLGKLIAARELPVLEKAKQILDNIKGE